MTAALREQFGNPSSVHHYGQVAKAALDDARSAVAALIGGEPSEVVFTSGGTESDNVAIRGIAEAQVRVVCIDTHKFRPTRLPEFLTRAILSNEESLPT